MKRVFALLPRVNDYYPPTQQFWPLDVAHAIIVFYGFAALLSGIVTAESPANLCHHCRSAIHVIDGRVGRSESCDSCGYDLHVCLNCKHYDRASYNECREPMADRVVDKDRRNFCDYFALGRDAPGKAVDEKAAALKKLDDLFK